MSYLILRSFSFLIFGNKFSLKITKRALEHNSLVSATCSDERFPACQACFRARKVFGTFEKRVTGNIEYVTQKLKNLVGAFLDSIALQSTNQSRNRKKIFEH